MITTNVQIHVLLLRGNMHNKGGGGGGGGGGGEGGGGGGGFKPGWTSEGI